ncbi:MAG: GAF domain-containing protein [Anaerolineae bacterium]|nr:GAF domain-containing protein [Anaerolineae bacterium]
MQTSRQLPFGLGLRYNYTDYFERQRAITLLYLMLIVGIGTVGLLTINIANAAVNRTPFQSRDYIPLIALLLALVVTYLIQNGHITWAARLLVAISFGLLILVQETSSILTWSTMNALVMVSAGLLLNRLSIFMVGVALVINLLRVAVNNNDSIGSALSQGYATALILLIIMAVFFLLFNGLFENSVRRQVDGNEQMTTVGKFLRRIPRKNEDETYLSVINFIRNELRYNFVQIFLVDDDTGLLSTRIRTGLGIALDATRSDARVNDTSALMQALRTKESVIVDRRQADMRRDHFLPSTVYGVALPVIIRDDVVAVIDVQHSEGQFNRMRMRALELLAEGLSLVLDDVITINALRLVLNDQSSTLDNIRRQLNEYKQYEKQVVGGVWDEYLQGRGYEAIGFDLTFTETDQPTLSPAFDLPEDIAPSLESREVHVELGADGNRVYVPIILRGEVLGVLRFVLPANNPPSERQLDLIQSVVDRLALALENKRLFEQSRSQAIRERKANEVARELIGATEVRDVLNLAAQMFNDALGAIHTRIQLQPDVMKSSTLTHEIPTIPPDTQSMGDEADA